MKKSELIVNDNKFSVLVAETEKEKQIGLMYIPPPAPIMVFPYTKSNLSFWMKNTPSPLDIVFCLNGEIKSIKSGIPFSTELIHGGESDLVIEFPKGYCIKYNIKVGDNVELK